MSDACRREPEVLRAAAEDRWSTQMRAHVAECRDCTAAAETAQWMHSFSKISDREHLLPDPSLVWLKARLLQGSVDAARISRPLNVAQFAAYLIVASAWAALLTWKWNAIEHWLRGFTPSGIVANAAQAESLSLSFFGSLLALASITVMLALHTILTEE